MFRGSLELMELRKSKKEDIQKIMSIIKKAQKWLKEQGIDQWQNNYPNPEIIEKDIENEESYVLVDDKEIVGTTVLSFAGEDTYDIIYKGEWVIDKDYAVIHRIAVDMSLRGKGLASIMLEQMEDVCRCKGVKSIKVDTHQQNKSMQRFLLKNGFVHRGIIYLKDGNERLAFEKLLVE